MKSSKLKNIKVKSLDRYGSMLVVLLGLLVLSLAYGKILKDPGNYLFAAHGDGFKSYYASIYHIEHDSTYSHFEGMNYPFGDHYLFNDGQTAITFPLKFIHENICSVSNWIIPIINLFMLLSIVLGALFIYLIFKKFKVETWLAIISSIAIAFLSPQLDRMGGHYSLAYVFAIPLLIYLLILYDDKKSWKLSFLISLSVFFLALSHLYYLLFAGLIFGFYFLFKLKEYFKSKDIIKRTLQLLLQLLLPYLIIILWMHFTNDYENRTTFPWGFFASRSGFEGVFLKNQVFNIGFIDQLLHPVNTSWEGYAYVGHLASLFSLPIYGLLNGIIVGGNKRIVFIIIIVVIGFAVKYFIRRDFKFWVLSKNPLLNVLLWIALFSLLFAYGYPFNLKPDLLKYSGAFKQFRAIGRLSWMMFYVLNIAAIVIIASFKKKSAIWYYILAFIAIALLSYDSFQHNKTRVSLIAHEYPFFQDEESVDNQFVDQLDVDEYAAIIPLPYYHVGSENIWWDPKHKSLQNSMNLSIRTGLPMTAALLGRNSMDHTIMNAALFLENYSFPEIFEYWPEQGKFLICYSPGDDFRGLERELLKISHPIYEGENISLLEIGIKDLSDFYKSKTIEYRRLINGVKDDLSLQEVNSISEVLLHEIDVPLNETTILIDRIPTDFTVVDSIIIGLWFSPIKKDMNPRSELIIEELDANKQIIKKTNFAFWRHLTAIDANRGRSEFSYVRSADAKFIRLSFKNTLAIKGELKIEDLMVSAKDQ